MPEASRKTIAIVCTLCAHGYTRTLEEVRGPADLECPSCSRRPHFIRVPRRAPGEHRDDYAVRLEAFIRHTVR